MNFKDYPLWFMFSTQRKILVISRVLSADGKELQEELLWTLTAMVLLTKSFVQ